MKGKNAIELYLNFKVNWIIDFGKAVLPKKIHKSLDDKDIRNTLHKYYVDVLVNNKSIDEVLNNTATKERIKSIFIENNITDLSLQMLFACLFKEEVILNWTGKLSVEEINKRDLCFTLATIIKIALDLDGHIGLDASLKIPFLKAFSGLLDKYELSLDTKGLFKTNKRAITKVYNKYSKNNLKFVINYNENSTFRIKRTCIYEVASDERTEMFLSDLDYSIKELKKKVKNRVARIEETKKIKENLLKIEFDLLSFDIFKKLYNHKSEYVFIDLYEDFLTKKSNISYIEDTICAVKDNIILNLGYDQLLKYADEVSDLKEKGYNFSYYKEQKEISFKKMYDTKYFFVKYEESVAFNKILKELALGKIEPIVIKPEDLKDANYSYYIK